MNQNLEIGPHISGISPAQIKENVERRLKLERISEHFDDDLRWPPLRTDRFLSHEVVKVDFPTMRAQYRDLYDSDFYRVALITRFIDLSDVDILEVLSELTSFCDENAIDRLVICTLRPPSSKVSSILKSQKVQAIYVGRVGVQDSALITNFINPPGPFQENTVYLNILGEMLVKRLRKLFHLVLSEVAAPIYDEHYGENRPATTRIQSKEEEIICQVVDKLKQRQLAVDVGCGTGRHALKLAPDFDRVIGFDFSPKMIERATANRRASKFSASVDFHVSDVEYESLPGEEEQLVGKVDLVCASFGMGSFVEDTDRLIRKFATWLSPKGKAIISFYNGDPASRVLKPDWRNSALAATIDPDANILRVELSEEASFSIFCKPYTDRLGETIKKYLGVQRTIHYPTTLALMPGAMLRSRSSTDFFGKIDDMICEDPDNRIGFYVTLVCEKLPGADRNTIQVKSELDSLSIPYLVVEHGPAFSAQDARREIKSTNEIDDQNALFLKTVIFETGTDSQRKRPIEQRQFASVTLPWDKNVDKKALAAQLDYARGSVVTADKGALFQLGFPLGGVSPFGLSAENVSRFTCGFDRASTPSSVVFGSGSHLSSILIEWPDFDRLFSTFRHI